MKINKGDICKSGYRSLNGTSFCKCALDGDVVFVGVIDCPNDGEYFEGVVANENETRTLNNLFSSPRELTS